MSQFRTGRESVVLNEGERVSGQKATGPSVTEEPVVSVRRQGLEPRTR
ncbi:MULTISPECIES: hypothetical protein [Streptomyces]|nr:MULTISPECIES: hypothetical protein [Streptomyces]MCI4143418.1 hypothetical protein [Streptomyces sp. MMS20-AI2-20]